MQSNFHIPADIDLGKIIIPTGHDGLADTTLAHEIQLAIKDEMIRQVITIVKDQLTQGDFQERITKLVKQLAKEDLATLVDMAYTERYNTTLSRAKARRGK